MTTFRFAVVCLGFSANLRAHCATVPTGFIAFQQIYYVSEANGAGDRLVVGRTDLPWYQKIANLPSPTTENQKFRGPLEIAPGFTVDAYVPTAGSQRR